MFCNRRRARTQAPLLACLAALSVSCSRTPQRNVERLAILRFENLTGDVSLDWAGRAVSEVMIAELTGSRTVSVISFNALHGADRLLGPRPWSAPGVSAERTAALLSGATRILYGRITRSSGTLRLHGAVYDTASQKIESTASITAAGADEIIPAADKLAKELSTPVRRFETQNTEALRDYCAGLEARDADAAAQAFARAIQLDSGFGEAYVAWAQLAASRENTAEAERVLGLAAARGQAVPDVERARLAYIGAELRRDPAAAVVALEMISRLTPADFALFRQLAQTYLNARRYTEAADNLKKAIAIEPADPVLRNQLGYTEMYAGNLAEASGALGEYARLRPDDPNALDSLGEVHYYLGRFEQAEKYFRQAYEKDESFAGGADFMKAAHARLMTGDVSGADAIFKRYLDARRKTGDPLAELRGAEWNFMSGRRRQAIAQTEAFAQALPAGEAPTVAPQLYAQIAIWELELGDQARAAASARRAASQPATTGPALIARFLTEPAASASEWAERAAGVLPGTVQERTRKAFLAYALLLQKDFQSAQPVLSDLYQHSPPEPQQILPVMLAWADVETGRLEEASRLLQGTPVPSPAPELFESLAFPRLLFLRGAVLEKLGRHQDAVKSYRLFLTLSGPVAMNFGEEARAQQVVGK